MRIGIKRTLRIQANELEQFLGGASATTLGELLHLGLDKHRRVQRRESVLINHGNFAAAKLVLFLLSHRKQVLALIQNLARYLCFGVEQAHDGERRDRLAAARFADQTHGLMRANFKAHIVNDVHIAMARELDAEVLHFKNRFCGNVRCGTVGTLVLDNLKLGQTLLQRSGLGLVREHGVGNKAVSLAVAVQVGVACLDGSLRSGGHSVGHAFGKNIQAQNRNHDGQAREQRLPPTASKHASTSVGKNIAPRWSRLRNASRDERKRSLENNGVCHEHDGKDQNRRDAVTHNVLPQNPRGTSAGNDNCTHVIFAVFAHNVRTNDAGDLRNVQKTNGENQRR